jgi:gamma-D-glutamyl-L-lysine dipeptidyl-peptidase
MDALAHLCTMSEGYTCTLSQMPLRKEPLESSECVSTLLYGESYRLLEVVLNPFGATWYCVSCDHDGYMGFISDAHHQNSKAGTSQRNHWTPFSCPHPDFPHLWLSPGSIVASAESQWPEISDVRWLHQFLGVPYYWGGRSIFGIDCSGLSQQYARFKGKYYPRDAKDQVLLGTSIAFGSHQLGDLAFFSKTTQEGDIKITHVGILIDSDEIIHASGVVRIDIFHETGILRRSDGVQTHHLHSIKRFDP